MAGELFIHWYGKLDENDGLASAPDCTGNPFYSSFSEEYKDWRGKRVGT